MKRLTAFKVLTSIMLLLFPAFMWARNTMYVVETIDRDGCDSVTIESLCMDNGIDLADTICSDLHGEDSLKIAQRDLKWFDRVDICYNPQYAIVTKDGKKGIYDLVQHETITEIEFHELGFTKQVESEDSTSVSMFYAKKGIKHGIIGVDESTNSVISLWMDDPDEVYTLDDCTTIDMKITKHVKKLLESFVTRQQMDNAQVVILDAKTGRLKTWLSIEADMEKEDAGKLLVHSCSGSLTKPFHTVIALMKSETSLDSVCQGVSYRQAIKVVNNEVIQHVIQEGYYRKVADRKWKELTDTQNSSTNPFILAVGYNSLANEGKMIIPTMKADSVNVEEGVFSTSVVEILRNVLKVDRDESPQLAWLTKEMRWIGYATVEEVYSEEDRGLTTPVDRQIQFAGVFPAEAPKYTICVVADKHSLDIEPIAFQDFVNPLSQWLLKRE